MALKTWSVLRAPVTAVHPRNTLACGSPSLCHRGTALAGTNQNMLLQQGCTPRHERQTDNAIRRGFACRIAERLAPAIAPVSPPISSFPPMPESWWPEDTRRPPPTNATTRPSNISVPTTCAGESVVRFRSANEPSAPDPAEENPTSTPIPAAIHGSHSERSLSTGGAFF